MSILSKITTGRIQRPVFIVVHGPDGIGKTTFAAGAPKPLFVGSEGGTAQLDVDRLNTPTVDSLNEVIDALLNESTKYKTLVLDSLDWLEPAVHDEVCRQHNKYNIEDFGYGKGFEYAKRTWVDIKDKLMVLRETANMNVVLIAHSQARSFKNPDAFVGDFDRWELKLHKTAAAIWREAADAVLFANYEISSEKQKGKDDRVFAKATGRRILHTEYSAAWDAKNRFGFEPKIELSWAKFEEALKWIDTASVEFRRLAEKFPSEKQKILDFYEATKNNPMVLRAGLTRLQQKAGE